MILFSTLISYLLNDLLGHSKTTRFSTPQLRQNLFLVDFCVKSNDIRLGLEADSISSASRPNAHDDSYSFSIMGPLGWETVGNQMSSEVQLWYFFVISPEAVGRSCVGGAINLTGDEPLSEPTMTQATETYRNISDIRRTKAQTLSDSRLALQLSLPNPLKPGVKSRMKI